MEGHRLFYTCPVNDAELLAVMLEKHDIAAKERVIEPMPEGEDEFSRPVEGWVPEADYDRAYRLFFGDLGRETQSGHCRCPCSAKSWR